MNETKLVIVVLIAAFILIMAAVKVSQHIKSQKYFQMFLTKQYGKEPQKDKDFTERLSSLKSYWEEVLFFEKPTRYVDDITWNDLDMNEIYQRVNGCHTSVGEEYLYAALRRLEFDKEPLDRRDEIISHFSSREEERVEVQKHLFMVGKNKYNGLNTLLYRSENYHTKNYRLYQMMCGITGITVVLVLLLKEIGIFLLVCSLAANAILHYKDSIYMQANMDVMEYMVSFFQCVKKLIQSNIYQDEVIKEELIKNFEPFQKRVGNVTNLTYQGSSDMDVFAQIPKIFLLKDLILYNKFIGLIGKNQEQFRRLFEIIGELDMDIAIASYRASVPHYCIPELEKGKRVVDAQKLYHPLLKNPVSNDILMKQNSIITGSNASGKSTFIKALAINSIFAQTLHTCLASQFASPFFLTISSMAVRDDIMEGESYFIREIKSLKRIIDQLSEEVPSLCFIDEILKGTNTTERISASAAVLDYLSEKNCLCVVASHDIELTRMEADRYDNYHFREQMTEEGIFFDYKIKKGPSQTRNAIKLLSYLGFQESIVKKAEKYVKSVE